MSDPMTKGSLAALELPALAESLVTISREVRRAVASGDQATIARVLDEVRSAADVAAGERGLLLQVAEAFLRAMANTDLGVAERAVRTFVSSHGSHATSLLAHAVSSAGIPAAVVEKTAANVRADLQLLVRVGALRQLHDGRLDVRPSLRGVVRDLIEPLAFRLWSRVEEARAHAAYQERGRDTAAVIIATRVGVSERQAEDHLRSHPLTIQVAAQGGSVPAGLVLARPERYARPRFVASGQGGEVTFDVPVLPTAQDDAQRVGNMTIVRSQDAN